MLVKYEMWVHTPGYENDLDYSINDMAEFDDGTSEELIKEKLLNYHKPKEVESEYGRDSVSLVSYKIIPKL